MSQSCFLSGFSLKILSGISLNRGYKGIYMVGWEGMWKVRFSQTGCSSDLTSRLGWVASSSRKQTAWPTWDFCPIVQQLARRFNFWHAWNVCIIQAACNREPLARSNRESLLLCTNLSNSSYSLTHYPYIIPT